MFFESKTASGVKAYTYRPDIVSGDSIESFVVTPTGATVDDQKHTGRDIILMVSGGTAGQTASFLFAVTTVNGETVRETVYLPIIDSPAQIADTARDYINFALRKLTGIGETPDADELDDALERLNALIARWRAGGADIGAAFPITASTVIYCPDWAVSALRYNMILEVADIYGAEVRPGDYERAMRGLQLVKHKNLPDEREVEFY